MDRVMFEMTRDLLIGQAGILTELDLPEFLAAIDRAEAIGPLLDPTLFVAAAAGLQDLRDLAEAANRLRNVALHLRAKGLIRVPQ